MQFKRILLFITLYSIIGLSFAQPVAMYEDSFRQFLKDVQAHSIKNRDWSQNDWHSYIQSELNRLPFSSKQAFYNAIQEALNDLGDHHSFLLTASSEEYPTNNILDPIFIRVEEGIGIINFPTFTDSPTEKLIDQFHQDLMQVKSLVTKGWIINIQNNLGGNMYPMLACLSDFWINTELGGFYYYAAKPEEQIQKITFDGRSFYSNHISLLTYKNTYAVGTIIAPTIVLIGSKTGSSAEFLALALKRQPNSTLVGQATHGLATGNEHMVLPNQLGHYMLTVANDLDEFNKPLLNEKVEPSFILDPCLDQIKEAKKLLLKNTIANQ